MGCEPPIPRGAPPPPDTRRAQAGRRRLDPSAAHLVLSAAVCLRVLPQDPLTAPIKVSHVTLSSDIHIRRLGQPDRELARATFVCMAEVFDEAHVALSDAYLDALLGRDEFWVFAATHAGRVVGGLTAHTLPMTTSERAEVFLFDIAVAPDHQRQGIGRRLIEGLRRAAASAGIGTLFVLADDEDAEAVSFYAALGGQASNVTQFEFS